MDLKYALTGLIVGLLVGMTGMGGGSLMTPLLIIFFKFKASVAVGSDLAYSAVMKVFGSFVHKKAGTVDMPLVCAMVVQQSIGSPAPLESCSYWLRSHFSYDRSSSCAS